MAREYVCVYYSYLDSLAPLSDEQFGRLIRAALRYSCNGEEPTLPEPENLLWPFLRLNIDRNNREYEQRCRQNRENALKRYGAGPESGPFSQ